MTDSYGPYETQPWSEAQWVDFAYLWANSGVIGTPASAATAGDLAFSSSGLNVSAGIGKAWIGGTGFKRTGTPPTHAVTANAHATWSRRDRLVLRRDPANNQTVTAVLSGTPAASPAAPTLTQSDTGSWELPLFSFLVPPNSGTSLSGIQDERLWLSNSGQLQVFSKAVLDAYTVGQTVPARTKVQDVTTGYQWERAGSSWVTPLRMVTGVTDATFTNTSFAFASLDFTSGGFTSPPVVTATTYYGNGYNTYVEIDNVTLTGATAVARSGANLNGPIPVHWHAVGR